ncbi:SDR family NAD(P)-dependent oxidoreductase [Microbacterium gorillae]|uniref:SDR family NAD(P)-dependent oxidoreductase n=1 Tax=Microbacterium gorillae TaxID=1231063 RepID=UPI003D960598
MTRWRWGGTHVLVTGGSEGIGAAVAAAVRERGARVTILARRPGPLGTVAAQIDALAVPADVTDAGALRAAVATAIDVNGPIDVLVHCAGTALPGRFLDVTEQEFADQMRLNHLGTVNALRAVLPGMVERGVGRVVVTSSTAAVLPVPGYAAYGAAKAAVAMLAAVIGTEVEPRGVRIGVLYPPDTKTPGFDAENLRKPPETAAISAGIAPQSPERVAAVVLRGVERGLRSITADFLTRALLVMPGVLIPVMRPVLARIARRAIARA